MTVAAAIESIEGFRVYVSAFELYRIGPGPSSTYTVGPQRAALRFVHDLAADGLMPSVYRIEAELYGGLAFHGREHDSPQAIVAGLAGHAPERCDHRALTQCFARAEAETTVLLGGKHRVRFDPAHDLRQVIDQSLAYDGNAVRFLARSLRGEVVASRLYFSTGGGGVLAEGDGADGSGCRACPTRSRRPSRCSRCVARTASASATSRAPMSARCSVRVKFVPASCCSRKQCAPRWNAD